MSNKRLHGPYRLWLRSVTYLWSRISGEFATLDEVRKCAREHDAIYGITGAIIIDSQDELECWLATALRRKLGCN